MGDVLSTPLGWEPEFGELCEFEKGLIHLDIGPKAWHSFATGHRTDKLVFYPDPNPSQVQPRAPRIASPVDTKEWPFNPAVLFASRM